ncbi:hypothetical protein CDO52_04175 [Nocardiopsis gilva YIM 90087]|uniref:Uncharacterized protein n=1 Tax=Nocardiopsis gilva YIM 90087 TaxID=1235441 RepID=A0A223S1S7_9ACTN|nr:DUF6412 domain-containing protein [Nocardiopsis gilva]ASU82083.1 hypothetical protein CDO52_04175 [Nocardiopsis gilva YIM 90087]
MVSLYTLFHVLFAGLDDPWSLVPTAAPGGALALLALVAVGAALSWIAVRGLRAWPPLDDGEVDRSRAMLWRSERLTPPPLRDPDAPGKPRPRAPGAVRVAV